MTLPELVARIQEAIETVEGFRLSREQARRIGATYPTKAQRLANPGNLRAWKDAQGNPYPRSGGYVDFLTWAKTKYPGLSPEETYKKAVQEGRRALAVQITRLIQSGRARNLIEFFRIYAPSSDGNDPDRYARTVARMVKIRPDQDFQTVLS